MMPSLIQSQQKSFLHILYGNLINPYRVEKKTFRTFKDMGNTHELIHVQTTSKLMRKKGQRERSERKDEKKHHSTISVVVIQKYYITM